MPEIQTQYIEIKESGVYATANIPASTNLGPGFMKIRKTGDPKLDFVETKLGKHISHSNNPNLFIKISRWKYYLFTNRSIMKGEELTLDHNLIPWKVIGRKPIKIDSSINPISKWKKVLNLYSISKDEFPRAIENKYTFSEKIDGETNCMIYKRGTDPIFLTSRDMMRRDLLVLTEYKAVLERAGVETMVLIGEGTAIHNGQILPFNKIQSILKTAYKNSENDKIYNHHPFEIFSMNGKKFSGNWNKNIITIENIFKLSKRIHPVRHLKGHLDSAWETFLTRPGIEGLMARNGRNFKIKRSFSFDLVIVGVGHSDMKSWKRGQISYLKVAFMNKPGELILATNVGTGFTLKTRGDLFKWAQLNKVDEKDGETWVIPSKIVEVRWLRMRKTSMPTYRYINGRYKYIGDKSGYSLIQPSLIGYRDDKKVSIFDVGFRQIPADMR